MWDACGWGFGGWGGWLGGGKLTDVANDSETKTDLSDWLQHVCEMHTQAED